MELRDGLGLRRSAEEIEFWKCGECADAGGKGAEEFDGAEAVGVQRVVDVAREVGADGIGADGEAWVPLGDELLGVGAAGVAAGGQVCDELVRRKTCGCEGFGADGPDGCDPGKAGEFAPEMGEIEPEQRHVGGGVDGGAVLASEQCWIADEECGIGGGKHGQRVCGLVEEGGLVVVEVLEEDVGVGVRTAAGSVGGEGADLLEGFVGGEARGIFDEQENAADLVA